MLVVSHSIIRSLEMRSVHLCFGSAWALLVLICKSERQEKISIVGLVAVRLCSSGKALSYIEITAGEWPAS